MRIVFTGGGTAGHVLPNLPLIEALQQDGWSCAYIGSADGYERAFLPADLEFHGIRSGKLRRYFSWQNFVDPFLVLAGVFQALAVLLRKRPHILFSKGGFVAVPAVVAAWLLRVPVVCHESDLTPGLANRLSYPFARRVCTSFESLAGAKWTFTGSPVRSELTRGDRQRGLEFCGLGGERPVLLVMGGSLGAQSVNLYVRQQLPALLEQWDVVHLAGSGRLEPSLAGLDHYVQFEYVGAEMGDVLACADLVVSRAGANAVFELLTLRKPHLLIPLTLAQSRGDQIQNAKWLQERRASDVLFEDDLNVTDLAGRLALLRDNAEAFVRAMADVAPRNGVDAILAVIRDEANPSA